MPVLHVTQATTGGVETSLILLLRHFPHERYVLELACPPGTVLASEARRMGVTVFEVPMLRQVHPARDFACFVALVGLMRRRKYSIVHAHSAKAGILGRAAAFVAGVPHVVYSPRGFSFLSQQGAARRFFLMLERLARRMTDRLVATSASERDRAVGEVGFSPTAIRIVRNGIDAGEVIASSGKGGPPTVLTVSRLTYQKNPLMFLRLAARVARVRPEVRFVLVGAKAAGGLEVETEEALEKLGLSGIVELLPWQPKADVLALMQRSSAFVLTSRFEGMPNVLLEAMLLRLPVVATAVDGSRDVIADGETGWLVPDDDDAAMAEAVLRILDGPAEAAVVAAQAERFVRDELNVARTCAGFAAVYDELTLIPARAV